MTGYQQGILTATGSWNGDRYCVRNIDRWYCGAVQPLFGTAVYPQTVHSKTQWVVKSARVIPPDLSDISDHAGFCRAYIEIHGLLDTTWRQRRGGYYALRLRIFGQEPVLNFIADRLPAETKKISSVINDISGGYTGRTGVIYYQSQQEVADILNYIDGNPRNPSVWSQWNSAIQKAGHSILLERAVLDDIKKEGKA